MTKGSVAILGATGRNLASGMTGGELFVLREHATRLGPTPLVAHELDADARARLRALLEAHAAATGSQSARRALDAGPEALDAFVRLAVPVAQPAALVAP
jgi:glutamate synthase (NADPH/NADH) large chain